jgi:CRP-like cAMP-binding protein
MSSAKGSRRPSARGVADHGVQSLDRCEVALIPRSALLDLVAERPAVRTAMWTDTLIDAAVFGEWMVNVGRRDSRARIAHLLCELVVRLTSIHADHDGVFDFPITQEQLADATGLTSVHTNRTLQGLRKDGLIELGARSLKVLDWEELCDVGDFEELYLHREIPTSSAHM